MGTTTEKIEFLLKRSERREIAKEFRVMAEQYRGEIDEKDWFRYFFVECE